MRHLRWTGHGLTVNAQREKRSPGTLWAQAIDLFYGAHEAWPYVQTRPGELCTEEREGLQQAFKEIMRSNVTGLRTS